VADHCSVGTATNSTRGFRWYVAFALLVTAGYPLLPDTARAVTTCVILGATVVPLVGLLPKQRPQDRLPWALLALAMGVLTGGNVLSMFGGGAHKLNAEVLITVGHALVLVAAVTLVLRRGRNDIGGLLDVSVTAVGLGGLLWTALIFPRLQPLRASPGEQLALLVSILVLVGVLGALSRVWMVADRRLPALHLLVYALVLALVGNVWQATSLGTMTGGSMLGQEMFFLLTYLCIGAAPLHPSVHELAKPGPTPDDRLSVGRLIFLGAALVVSPLVGGAREMIGLPADGPLLAVGSLLVAPLVMVRVGRLAHQRQQAEQALLHQATHDTLTGLPNRGELLNRLDAALRRERRLGRPAVVLLFCDLNGFKGVNDRLGHLAGDLLLTEVGVRIRTGLREGDTVARYGGDEFLVLCEEEAQEAAATRLRGHIETALARPFRIAGAAVDISSSIGAVISDGAAHADELITRADQAMYRAKQRGRAEVG
jgi:diguanylate cyclase (GGDEF)-like protein